MTVGAVMLAGAVAYEVIEHWENLDKLPSALTRHVTPVTTLWVAVIGLFLVLGVMVEERLLGHGAKEEANGEAAKDAPAPDVMLRLDTTRQSDISSDDPAITVYNARDMAMHIQIDPVDTGEYQIGSKIADGNAVAPLTASTTMVFSDVPDLGEGESAETRLGLDSASVQFAMMTAVKQKVGLWWFIDHVYEHKWYDEQRQAPVTPENSARAEASVKHTDIELSLRLTYWNRDLTKQWERIETLTYDPATQRVSIRHGKPYQITGSKPPTHARTLDDVGHAIFVNKTKRLVEACELSERQITMGIAYSPTSADAQTFANQIAAACRDARFRLRGVGALHLNDIKTYPGIWILKENSWGGAYDPPIDEALRNAFKDAGYKAIVSFANNYPACTFEIIIGD